MKLLVTGATGFIGAHFVRRALCEGHTVLATHRRGSRTIAAQGLKWLESELDALPSDAFASCDALVHFAAVGVSPKPAVRSEMEYWNVAVPQQLLEKAKAGGVRRIVLAGSFAEYGRAAERYDLIPPDAPLMPTSAYAASKAACFITCHAAAIELGLELCYLRIFSAYGDGQSVSNLWPALRAAAMSGQDFPMTGGDQLRDFIPAEDVAREFLHAVQRAGVDARTPLVWNVGSGLPQTIRSFAEYWWHHWHATGMLKIGALPYRENEVMRFAPLITERSPASRVASE